MAISGSAITFFFLKGVSASQALVFQAIALALVGSTVTGQINKLHLISMSAAMLILPGFEVYLNRKLPFIRRMAVAVYKKQIIWLTVVLGSSYFGIILLQIFLSFQWDADADVSLVSSILVIFSYSIYLCLARITPVLLRINENMNLSVLFEPGLQFALMSFLVLIFFLIDVSPSPMHILLLSLICGSTLGLGVLIYIFFSLFLPCRANYEDKIDSESYSISLGWIPISNYLSMWGLAAFASMFMGDADTAIMVTILRSIGLLLFVEGAVVSYFLPTLSSARGTKEYGRIKLQMVRCLSLGTIIFVPLVFCILYVTESDAFVYALFLVLVFVQLINCNLGSPYALICVLQDKATVYRISCYVCALSILFGLLVPMIRGWELVVCAFILIQSTKMYFSHRALVQVEV